MNHVLRSTYFVISVALVAVGCSNSNPTIDVLQKPVSPTKEGAAEWTERVTGLNSTLQIPSSGTGSCDPRSSAIEYSLDDGKSWTNINALSGSDGDCADGNFRITLPASALGFDGKHSGSHMLRIRQVLGGAPTTAALVTMKYEAPHLRAQALRQVLGSAAIKTSQLDVKLRVYARGEAR